jgi:hypothetical protein
MLVFHDGSNSEASSGRLLAEASAPFGVAVALARRQREFACSIYTTDLCLRSGGGTDNVRQRVALV